MRSAFGIDHGEVSKGLPRYVRGTPQLKPLQARKKAHLQGRHAAKATAVQRQRPGSSTLRYVAGEARNSGRQARAASRKVMA